MIYFENLNKTNSLFIKNFKKNYDMFIQRGQYILGKNVLNFEKNFAKYIGTKYCIGVGNGLDALTMALKALDLPKNSEVIVASNAYIASVISIINANLKPILCEPDISSYNINTNVLKKKITKNTKAIMAVHMYGKPCNMREIKKICNQSNIFLIEDCSQAHGATFENFFLGTFGDLSCFSFYPTKNLGCLGDGGAILTNSNLLDKKLRGMRNYGSIRKYYNDIFGQNSRLDEFQACFLNVKLKSLDKINNHKIRIAKLYDKYLNAKFIKPVINKYEKHVFHIYNIRHPKRDILRKYLKKNKIQTEIHYPVQPSEQKAYKNMFKVKCLVSKEIHETTLSLPISYSHKKSEILKIIQTLNNFKL